MPERQSSPGEATARPETDDTQTSDTFGGDTGNGAENGVPDGTTRDVAADEDGPVDGGAPPSAAPGAGEPAEPVADQIDAAPDATEPAATEPAATARGDGAPTGQGAPQTAAEVAGLATGDPATGDPATAPRPATAAPAETSRLGPATGDPAGTATPADDAAATPVSPPVAGPPAARPRPRPGPGAPAVADPGPAATVPPAAGPASPAQTPPAQTPPAQPPSAQPPPAQPPPGPASPPAAAAAAATTAGTNGAGSETVATPDPDTPVPDPEGPTRPTNRPGPDSPTVAVPRPSAPPAPPAGWDAEATQVIPLNAIPATDRTGDPPTERIALAPAAASTSAGGTPTPPAGRPPVDGGKPRRRRSRPLLIVAVLVALLALLYVGDLLLSSGAVPRGVTVAGVPVGGLSLADAEQRLREEIEPRAQQPVVVTVGEVGAELDPTSAGLIVDWAGTLDQAGAQPLNPITRIMSLLRTRDLGVVTTVDRVAVTGALGELGPVVDREPAEGTVRFEGTTPVPVDPVPGQRLDQEAAIGVLETQWASGVPVDLPLIALPTVTTADDVAAALTEVAQPAVSAPVAVIGEQETEGVLEPETIAEALSFEPGAEGGLDPVLNPTVVTDALTPQLAGSEVEARDAVLNFGTTPPSVTPSQDGRGVDYDATLVDLLSVLTGTGPREIAAVYSDQPAELTTAELEGLGVSGLISEFQTGGFAQDSGQNIRRAAELVNDTVVEPGETFSLDAVTGPRTAGNGYVEAGVIDDGRPGRGIAGGVSQVSTTLYNAAYFAGMTDVEHTPHSFYISRYPPGREATIATGAIDMRFRNDTPTAVLIRAQWTPSSVTVQLYGTKYFEVTSTPGPRTNPTSPNTVTIPPGEPCNSSNGAPGFTITDTRSLRNVQTGEVTTESRTTRYNPSPMVVCGG